MAGVCTGGAAVPWTGAASSPAGGVGNTGGIGDADGAGITIAGGTAGGPSTTCAGGKTVSAAAMEAGMPMVEPS